MSAPPGVRTSLARVVRVEQVTPATRRLTVGGEDLESFAPRDGDRFVHLLVGPEGSNRPPVDRDFSWERYRAAPIAERPVGAYYTVRHARPARGEVDLDVVLHATGAGTGFARRARPGDPVALWGPRTLHDPPAGTTSFLLVADDTAVPALCALVEGYPPGTRVRALAEVAGPQEERPVEPGLGVELELTWLHRHGIDAGGSTLLADAVAALGPLPAGTYAWGGAERSCISNIRRSLLHQRQLPEARTCLHPYWRRTDGPRSHPQRTPPPDAVPADGV